LKLASAPMGRDGVYGRRKGSRTRGRRSPPSLNCEWGKYVQWQGGGLGLIILKKNVNFQWVGSSGERGGPSTKKREKEGHSHGNAATPLTIKKRPAPRVKKKKDA